MALNIGAWQLYNTTDHLNIGAWQGFYITPTPPTPPPTPPTPSPPIEGVEFKKILWQYKMFFRYFFLPITLFTKEKIYATK